MRKKKVSYGNSDGTSGVYKIENIKNDKVYIGESFNIEERWKIHINDLNKGKHHSRKLQDDWNEYGKDYFKFDILKAIDVKSICEHTHYELQECVLLIEEDRYIRSFNACENGYNMENTINEILLGNKKENIKEYLFNLMCLIETNNDMIPSSIESFVKDNGSYFTYKEFEEIKWDESCLSDSERFAVEIGLNSIEDFKPYANIGHLFEFECKNINTYKTIIINNLARGLIKRYDSFNQFLFKTINDIENSIAEDNTSQYLVNLYFLKSCMDTVYKELKNDKNAPNI